MSKLPMKTRILQYAIEKMMNSHWKRFSVSLNRNIGEKNSVILKRLRNIMNHLLV